ncbi:hypothetical protein TH61_13190 [Rufibacter sp. DG15C]|uniref:DUF4905 domain-containing protein n=1 Tax=Rufibacter sp. DG15C TaxID=1379909 RepID=UPI00078B36C2|nr:DUF4905 domain-containing protein [Rufibacter sp. DG15C]AMM51945.1 hypothetical protein TH61_13190 [Rufibacter sp. DG15C]
MPSIPASVSYSFKGDIWRLLPDEATGLIGIEVRDTASLQVYFCILSPNTPEMVLDHFQVAELWWTGLAGFNDKVLYLHGFERTGHLGQPKGITAIEIATQKVLFEEPNAQWVGQRSGSILLSEIGAQPKVITEVDAFSGKVLKAQPNSEPAIFQENTKSGTQYPVNYPELYEEGSDYFEDLATFLLRHRGHSATGYIEYLELDSCFILSYYVVQENGLFVKFLVTYSLNGEALYECCPLKDAERIGGPPFFVQAGRLFLVQGKNILLSASIPVNVNFD